MRVVLVVEGAGETGTSLGMPPRPRSPISGEQLGAGHALVGRCLEQYRGVRADRIQFLQPLRTRDQRVPWGSDLHTKRILRDVLNWPPDDPRTDMAVVLVDEDRERGRYERLRSYVEDHPLLRQAIVAVARKEFESWLIAVPQSVHDRFGRLPPGSTDVESWDPGQAKLRLRELHAAGADAAARRADRIALAESIDLAELERRSTSFRRFKDDLVAPA